MIQKIELIQKLRDSTFSTVEADMQGADASKIALWEEIRTVALNVVKHPKPEYKISGTPYSWDTVAHQLSRLTPDHIEYVCYQISHLGYAIQYRPAYILSCLFNTATQTPEQIRAALAARIEQEENKENEFDLEAFCQAHCGNLLH